MTLHLNGTHGTAKAVKTKKPKMTLHRGRTWDVTTITINDEKVDMHFDSTWGSRGYFEQEGTWYSIDLYELAVATEYAYELRTGEQR